MKLKSKSFFDSKRVSLYMYQHNVLTSIPMSCEYPGSVSRSSIRRNTQGLTLRTSSGGGGKGVSGATTTHPATATTTAAAAAAEFRPAAKLQHAAAAAYQPKPRAGIRELCESPYGRRVWEHSPTSLLCWRNCTRTHLCIVQQASEPAADATDPIYGMG